MDTNAVDSALRICFRHFCDEGVDGEGGSQGRGLSLRELETNRGANYSKMAEGENGEEEDDLFVRGMSAEEFQRCVRHCGIMAVSTPDDVAVVLKEMATGGKRINFENFKAALSMLAVTAFPHERTTFDSLRQLATQTVIPASKALTFQQQQQTPSTSFHSAVSSNVSSLSPREVIAGGGGVGGGGRGINGSSGSSSSTTAAAAKIGGPKNRMEVLEVLRRFKTGLEKVFEHCFKEELQKLHANPEKVSGLSKTSVLRFLEDFGITPSPLTRAAANNVYASVAGSNHAAAMSQQHHNGSSSTGSAGSGGSVGGKHPAGSGTKQWLFESFLELLILSSHAAFAPCGTLGPAEMVSALLEVMHYSKGAEKLAAAKGWAGQARKLILSDRALNPTASASSERIASAVAASSRSGNFRADPLQSQSQQQQQQHQSQSRRSLKTAYRIQSHVSSDGWMYSSSVDSPEKHRDQYDSEHSNDENADEGERLNRTAPLNNGGHVLEALSTFPGVPTSVKMTSTRVALAAAEEMQVTGKPQINKVSENLSRSVPVLFQWQNDRDRRVEEQRGIARVEELRECRDTPELSSVSRRMAGRRRSGDIVERLLAEGELQELRKQQKRQEEEIMAAVNANPSILEKSASMVRVGEVSERLHNDAAHRETLAQMRQNIAKEEFSVDLETGQPLFHPVLNPNSEKFASTQRDRRSDPIEIWLQRWGEEKHKRVQYRAEQELESTRQQCNTPKMSSRSAEITRQQRSRSTPRRRRCTLSPDYSSVQRLSSQPHDVSTISAADLSGVHSASQISINGAGGVKGALVSHDGEVFPFHPQISQRSRQIDEQATVASGMRDRVQRLLSYKDRYSQQLEDARKEKEKQEMDQCSFAPQLSKRPEWMAQTLKIGTVPDRERVRQIQKERWIEEERRRKEQEEAAICTFKPTITAAGMAMNSSFASSTVSAMMKRARTPSRALTPNRSRADMSASFASASSSFYDRAKPSRTYASLAYATMMTPDSKSQHQQQQAKRDGDGDAFGVGISPIRGAQSRSVSAPPRQSHVWFLESGYASSSSRNNNNVTATTPSRGRRNGPSGGGGSASKFRPGGTDSELLDALGATDSYRISDAMRDAQAAQDDQESLRRKLQLLGQLSPQPPAAITPAQWASSLRGENSRSVSRERGSNNAAGGLSSSLSSLTAPTTPNNNNSSSGRPQWNSSTRGSTNFSSASKNTSNDLRQELFDALIDRRNLRVRGDGNYSPPRGAADDQPKYSQLHQSPPPREASSSYSTLSPSQQQQLSALSRSQNRIREDEALAAGAKALRSESEDVMRWSVGQVKQWIIDLGLAVHAPRFVEQNIDGHSLLHLSATDLEEGLNITHFGARKKILTAIAKLRGTLDAPLSAGTVSGRKIPRGEPEREQRLRQYVQNAMKRAAFN